MGFFSNLFRRRARPADRDAAGADTGTAEPTAEITLPATIEIVPGLQVRVVSHADTPSRIALWSFVTDGLRAHGQREIVISVVRRPGEPERAFPPEVLMLFKTIFRFASEGRIVVPGELTEFGPAGFLSPRLRALVYADAQPLEGVELPDAALAGILIDEAELAIVRHAGVYRVLTRLGQRHNRYPFPPWSDRDRPTVAHGDEAHSVLHQVGARANLAQVSLVLDGDQVRMQIPRAAAAKVAALLDQLPADRACVVFTDPAPNAQGRLVWFPGQTEPAAITGPEPSARRLTGGFLAIAVVDGATARDDQALGVEDGFSLVMQPATWAACKRAIAAGGAFALPAARPGGTTFELVWIEHDYPNPIDGTLVHAPGGWHTYASAAGGAGDAQRSSIVLLSRQDELARAITAAALAPYLKALIERIEASAPASSAKTISTLQIDLAPGRSPALKLRLEPSGPLHGELHPALVAIDAPAVRGPVRFQIVTRLGSDA